MVYLVGWGAMFLAALFASRRGARFFVFMILVYCVVLAFFRGNVGTDTVEYINIFQQLALGGEAAFSEPGFTIVSKMLLLVIPDADLAVKSISVVFSFLVLIYLIRSNEEEFFFLISYFLPAFYYVYSMNVIRAGLAAIIFLIIMQIISRRGGKCIKCLLIPVAFHFSAVLFFVYFVFFRYGLVSLRSLFYFFATAVVLIFIFILNIDYFNVKLGVYSDYSSPNSFSGARVIIPLFLIVMGFLLGRLPASAKLGMAISSLLLIAIAVWFVQVSYAGLRLLEILGLFIPAYVVFAYVLYGTRLDIFMKGALIISGVIFAVGNYLGFVGAYGQGDSPFLPYSLRAL